MLKASYIMFLGTITIAVGLAAYFSSSVEPVSYIGSSSCINCHESTASGGIRDRWISGPHAGAYDLLFEERSQEVIAQMSDSLESCLPCHSTLGVPALTTGQQSLLDEGVGCESCHGPGSLYSASVIMRDPGALSAYGGSPGSLDDCATCHRTSENDPLASTCPLDSAVLDPVAAWEAIGHSGRAGARDSIYFLNRGADDD